MKHLFDEFKFSVELTPENEKYLREKGYEKRFGTAAYPQDRKVFVVVPFKKWYWEDVSVCKIHLRIETERKIIERLVY